jgi:hypothetical protein
VVVYIYFNYQSRDTQSAVQITRTIVKQLISGLEIPEELRSIYEQSLRKDLHLGMKELIPILELCSRRFSSRFAIFDALDECSDMHKNDILDLFVNLQEFGYKLLISGRPPLAECYLSLSNACTLEIKAAEKDIKTYIIQKMKDKKAHEKVQPCCLELAKAAGGM